MQEQIGIEDEDAPRLTGRTHSEIDTCGIADVPAAVHGNNVRHPPDKGQGAVRGRIVDNNDPERKTISRVTKRPQHFSDHLGAVVGHDDGGHIDRPARAGEMTIGTRLDVGFVHRSS
ncbi:MAG: hypothetical protein LKI24_06305 [Acidipropionibacterium sp.]|jgi:hypothetical protein|nr:hypothetical protein [Acidipropionibacterium sp.]